MPVGAGRASGAEEAERMAHTYHELKAMTVGQLREMAKGIEHEAVKGYTQLNKEHLLVAICKALNIATHEHHEVVGLDKTGIKAKIRSLRKLRDDALEAHDSVKLRAIRRHIHHYNHLLRKQTV
jgi:DNA-binding IclR family transcriptional regulator